MLRYINNHFKMILAFLGLVFLMTAVYAGNPVWKFEPLTNTTVTVPENGTAIVQYRVTNQSNKSHTLVMQPITGIRQITTGLNVCNNPFVLRSKESCTLSLEITGSQLTSPVGDGPVVCQQGSLNQCYRPSPANILRITRGPASGAIITVNPDSLSFVEGNNGVVTITNSIASPEPANNVIATIPGGSNISVQSTTCGASLAIGASCTITFTAPSAEGPTNISISGNNTNTANVAVTVTLTPQATISVNPVTLSFTENTTGQVTVTNDAGSPVAADNIAATIPGGSNISVQSTTCGASLAIGASCTITFTSAAQEGPTTIAIAGDNTNTVNVDVTVTSQPQISITSPVQQSRVIAVSGAGLSLEVTNDGVTVAENITVSNQAGCPDMVVDDSNCTSVAVGNSCTLELTSPTPYAPCTITVSGSNTANSPQALIAFTYLGGLVFQESGGSGKVVTDLGQEFTSEWAFSPEDINGAESLDNGSTNTTAILASGSCEDNPPMRCAARRCTNNIGPDWYLPALNELSAVHAALCANNSDPCNFGGFVQSFYWSSTQFDDLAARGVVFPIFGDGVITSKFNEHPVRCVRSFP